MPETRRIERGEVDTIEIEGSLIEIAGGINTARKTDDDDDQGVTMATGQGDKPTQDEEAAAWLAALEDGRMDWRDIKAIDQDCAWLTALEAGEIDVHAFTRLIVAKIRWLRAEEPTAEEPAADKGARWVAPTGARDDTNNTQGSETPNNNNNNNNNEARRIEQDQETRSARST